MERSIGKGARETGHRKDTARMSGAAKPAIDLVGSGEKFGRQATIKLGIMWGRYCLWERFACIDLDLANKAMNRHPFLGMYHAQQAVEKQIKAIKVYCSTFSDNYVPKKSGHDIFVQRTDKSLHELLSNANTRDELRKMTLGIVTQPSKSKVLEYVHKNPALLDRGLYVGNGRTDKGAVGTYDPRGYYEHLLRAIGPRKDRDVTPMLKTGSRANSIVGNVKDADDLRRIWAGEVTRIESCFGENSWRWRYIALFLHEEARYPADYTPIYLKKRDSVKMWIDEAGCMTRDLHDYVRECHTLHAQEISEL